MARFLEEPSHEHGIAFVRPELQSILDMESRPGEVGQNNDMEGDLIIEEELDIDENLDIGEEIGVEEKNDKDEEDEEDEEEKCSD
jgi:hypothetical protein